jgi:microsomal dipeptidase-like Zn-dependent dipeptidase/CubicO group peptidase (beta-lactamase class C family)
MEHDMNKNRITVKIGNAMLCAALVAAAGCAQLPARQAAPDLLTLDTHVDIPLDYMRAPGFDAGGDSVLQVDLDKMRRGGLDAAFFVIYVGQGPLTPEGYADAMAQADRKYSAIAMMLANNPGRIRAALTPAQVRDNHAHGLLSAMIGVENSYSLGHDLARIDAAFDHGARYLGLVHVGNNDLCSSANPDVEQGEPPLNSPADAGMSDFGRAAVARANALGMMVDISHASDRCVRDALAASRAPIIASHSSSRALVDVPRNLPDDLLRAIGADGGVVQAVAYKEFLKADPGRAAAEKALQAEVVRGAGDTEYDSEKHDYLPAMAAGMARIQQQFPLASLDEYVAHIRHMVDVAGIDHVGIASDFDGGGGITGWMDATQTGNVTAALRKAGFSDTDIAKVWGGNLLRVWQAAIDEAERERAAAIVPDRVDAIARAAMARYHLPGLALGVIDDGKVVFARGYGETVAGSGEAVDPATVFKIASNSKAMTASVLARLVQAGKLRWDDPVVKHLPGFAMHDPWVTEHMTVADLLVHDSGLPEGGGDLMLWPEPNLFDRADIVHGLRYIVPAYGFRAGYAYDNLLYVVAGELAGRVAGVPYETLVRRELFEPLGLQRCVVGEFDRDALGNVAQPHWLSDDGNQPMREDPGVVPAIASAPAGGIRCSLDDMLAWAGNWLDPTPAQLAWLDPTQRAAIWQARTPMPISRLKQRWDDTHYYAYAFGFRIADIDGEYTVSHTGTLGGMYSMMMLLPDRKSGFVFMTNGDGGTARTVLGEALVKLFTAPADRRTFDDYADDLAAPVAAPASPAAPAAPPLPDIATRVAVAAGDAQAWLGTWRDPWFGDVRICAVGEGVEWRSAKSPKMHGMVATLDGRPMVHWDDPGVDLDAWLDFGGSGNARTLRMAKLDPEGDFSSDYEDLAFRRVGGCD